MTLELTVSVCSSVCVELEPLFEVLHWWLMSSSSSLNINHNMWLETWLKVVMWHVGHSLKCQTLAIRFHLFGLSCHRNSAILAHINVTKPQWSEVKTNLCTYQCKAHPGIYRWGLAVQNTHPSDKIYLQCPPQPHVRCSGECTEFLNLCGILHLCNCHGLQLVSLKFHLKIYVEF